jgi:ABC-type nickel/cobalt efflux system permease component RcnA
MFGLDQSIANLSGGTTVLVVVAVAVLLGLRHASDPDHLAAVATLIASGREHAGLAAARLGLAWGLGHATALFAFGVPIVLYDSYLPESIQRAAETSVGLVIVAFAALLLRRWHRGLFREAPHPHHAHAAHVHVHHRRRPHGHRTRGPLQAYGIGLVHGLGGSAGVGVLLLATIDDHVLAVAALALFSVCTAISMALLSVGFGVTLNRPTVQRSFNRLAPALGLVSLVFGVWYILGAQNVVPYVL